MNDAGPVFPAEGCDIDAVHRRVHGGSVPATHALHWSPQVQALLRTAQDSGYLEGERAGYQAGVRHGRLTWLTWGFLAGAATVAACVRLGVGAVP
jgi:hypothetical protein